ncbi:hypothetical protein GCM10009532_14530 [Microbacterium aurantiacum]
MGVRHEVSAEMPALTPAARDVVGADDEEGGIRCRIRKGAVDVTVVDDLDRDGEAGRAEGDGEGLKGCDGKGVKALGFRIDDGHELQVRCGGTGALNGPGEGGVGFGGFGAGCAGELGVAPDGVRADADDDERGRRRRGIRLGCRGIRHGVSLGGEGG